MVKMEAVPPGEQALTERDARESNLAGECMQEGGSDWRKDAGEEGGATKGNTVVYELFIVSVTGPAVAASVGSGTSVA